MMSINSNMCDEKFDVMICGGGPVGLAAAYLLGREGLRVALFERRPGTTTLPKGQYLHTFTGELFRRWGVWDLLSRSGWKTEQSNGQGFYVNIARGPVAAIRATDSTHSDYENKWSAYSPVYPRKVPASDYEAALRQKASEWPNVSLMFNNRVTEVQSLTEGVEVKIENTETKRKQIMRARYLLACDGAHSFVRSQVGQGQDHGPTFGNQILVEFRASLDDTLGRDGFFHSFVIHPRYAGWFGSKHPDTGIWRYSFRHDEETLPPEPVILERLHGALGMPDLEIELVQIFRFDYSTGLLRQWRERNIMFLGDAAHWHSPWGGFGMNSGIQDANNLAWKLALVVKGLAGESLLDTYQVERRSKAQQTVKSATYNSLHYQAIAEAVRVGEGAEFATGSLSPEGIEFLRQRVKLHGDNSVLHTGYQLGTVYSSTAILSNCEKPPTPELVNYIETTLPGVRAPHAWLIDQKGERISTVDLWGSKFVLIGSSDATKNWILTAKTICNEFGINIDVIGVGSDGIYCAADTKFSTLYSSRIGQVTLVRPDGHIAANFFDENQKDATQALQSTINQILGLSLSVDSPIQTAAAHG